jgi:hypothetical protein
MKSLCLIKHHTMKAYGGVVVEVHAFFPKARERSIESYSRPGHLTPSERGSSNQDRWINGVQSLSGQRWEKDNLFFLPEIKNRFFCRSASRLIIQIVRGSYIDFLFFLGGGVLLTRLCLFYLRPPIGILYIFGWQKNEYRILRVRW